MPVLVSQSCDKSKGVVLIGSECTVLVFLERIKKAEEALCLVHKKVREAASMLNAKCRFPANPQPPVVVIETCILDLEKFTPSIITHLISPGNLDADAYEALVLMEKEICASIKKINDYLLIVNNPCPVNIFQ